MRNLKDNNALCVNTIRVLSVEMIEKAKSGHPGIALGASPVLYSLYSNILNVNPKNPSAFWRDRFVLSAGHGSAMLYATLHLFGYPYKIEDLKAFRQLNSITPGHPEHSIEHGVEATTGPLGQGVANAVGMAIAEKHLAKVFNKPDTELINNYTYALVGDGCLMEGVANEALSLAGTLNLNKLIVIYDFNKITIDGKIDITFKQNTKKVFEGYGFSVLEVADGNNVNSIISTIKKAQTSKKPTLIIVNSVIGYSSLVEGTEHAHGAPLGLEGVAHVKQTLGIKAGEFEILPQAAEHFKRLQQRFEVVEKKWNEKIKNYKTKYPNEFKKFESFLKSDYSHAEKIISELKVIKDMVSTRDLGGIILSELSKHYENIIGGAADLSGSTKTVIKSSGQFSHSTPENRNLMFGVREFAMSAVSNGIALYGALTPFASTFFVFSDYMRAGIRMSAISHLKVLYIFTHDSIGVGEDGPTHQSVEQLASFRAMPNVVVFRPCNLDEVKAAYIFALNHNGPTLIILTRQNLLHFETGKAKEKLKPSFATNVKQDVKISEANILKGGYVVSYEQEKPEALVIATGSEVEIALLAQAELLQQGVQIRVVSMPSMELFESQSEQYKNAVLPKEVKARVVIEAGSSFGWHKYAGDGGVIMGVNEFGKSAKLNDVYNYFDLTVAHLVKKLTEVMKNNK